MAVILALSACTLVPTVPIDRTITSTKPESRFQGTTDLTNATSFSTKSSSVDLWDRIRKRLSLKHDTRREEVQKQINWFQKHLDFLDRTLERASPVLHYIVEMVEARRMPAEVALLPIIESAYNPLADSHAGAGGIWQMMPSTAKNFGLKQSWWYDGRRDVHAATSAALNYLAYLHRYFEGDWLLAFAAYNWGEGNVSKAVQRNRSGGKPTDFWSLRLPKETSVYIPTLLALSEIVADPVKYQIKLLPILDQCRIVKVEVGSQIDLSFAAQIAELKVEELYKLNPGFFRWATDPSGPHYLMLPQKNAQLFQQRLSQLETHERISWQRYQVRSGDSLLSIANKFHASPDQIRSYNKLSEKPLTPGRTIMVPQVSRVPKEVVLPRILPSAARVGPKVTNSSGVSIRLVTLKQGDTLSKLSKRYKVSLKKLAEWNELSSKTHLIPGKKIKIFKEARLESKKTIKKSKKSERKKGKKK